MIVDIIETVQLFNTKCVVINVKSVKKDGSIFIEHQILGQALFAELF